LSGLKIELPLNPHSTGRLNLAAKLNDFGKILLRVFTKDLGMDSPSSRLKNIGGQAGEFIR
jgi:hypothetical protein